MCILFKDGRVKIYGKDDYTDYEYRHDVFVVIRGNQWIGIYPVSEIKSIEVE